jgi:hypothetical protein
MADPVIEQKDDVAAERDGLKEENLRLRDLLIARDAELGSLKGQVAALEAGSARILQVVARIRSLVPSFAWEPLARLARRVSRG